MESNDASKLGFIIGWVLFGMVTGILILIFLAKAGAIG